jgi:predicted Zn-dependent protease
MAKPVAREADAGRGLAEHSPGRLHPDLLPGAVNTTNLALRKAVRQIAADPPPVRTPYGQAEDAYRQGLQAYAANRTETSLQALRRTLELYPGHLPARELLADQYEMAGRTEEALTLLQKGLTIAPDYTPLRKRMARLLLDRGDAAGATKALIGGGLPKVEDDPELHQILAESYRQIGENFLAAQTYRNLLTRDPRNGLFWAGLGDVLTADGQPGEAHKAYRRALMVGGLSRESTNAVQQIVGNRTGQQP